MTNNLTPSQQYWSNKLLEAEQSGISLADFARQQDLPAQKLYQWRSTLKSKTQKVVEKTQFTRVVTLRANCSFTGCLILIGCLISCQGAPPHHDATHIRAAQCFSLHRTSGLS